MKALTSMLFAFVLAVSSVCALAQDKAPGSGPNPYVDCGIGAAIFPNVGWAAATSNAIWDIGITAIISATSSPETCSGSETMAAHFIHHSYDNLIEETAQGEGEYVNTMLNIYGCAAEARPQLIADVRNATSAVVTEAGYAAQARTEKVTQLFQIVNSTVNSVCSSS